MACPLRCMMPIMPAPCTALCCKAHHGHVGHPQGQHVLSRNKKRRSMIFRSFGQTCFPSHLHRRNKNRRTRIFGCFGKTCFPSHLQHRRKRTVPNVIFGRFGTKYSVPSLPSPFGATSRTSSQSNTASAAAPLRGCQHLGCK